LQSSLYDTRHHSVKKSTFTLSDLGLTDPSFEAAYDTVTRLTAKLLNTPVALVSIVEEVKNRQYFKSLLGLPEPWTSKRQTPLSHSFCQHVKRDAKPLVVSHAPSHPLVKDNLAIRDLNVIAYIGVPIFGPNGQALGALCAIDDKARDWRPEDLELMNDLAVCVTDEVLLRASLLTSEALYRDLEAAHEKARRHNALRESISHAFMAPDMCVEQRFQALLTSACSALKMDAGAITRTEFDQVHMTLFHTNDPTLKPEPTSGLGGSLTAQVLCDQKAVHYHDMPHSPLARKHDLFGITPGSYIGVPLVLEGTVFGTMEFSGKNARTQPWSEEEISVVTIVAMYACAHLGLLGQVRTLKNSESALLDYLLVVKSDTPVLPGI